MGTFLSTTELDLIQKSIDHVLTGNKGIREFLDAVQTSPMSGPGQGKLTLQDLNLIVATGKDVREFGLRVAGILGWSNVPFLF